MKKHSDNIKVNAGFLQEGINVFNNGEEISINRVYDVVKECIHKVYSQPMKKDLKKDYNDYTPELEEFTLFHLEDLDQNEIYVENWNKPKFDLLYLSLPIFEIKDNILYLKANSLIINEYLFEPGFMFTFDDNMMNKIKNLSKVKIVDADTNFNHIDIYSTIDLDDLKTLSKNGLDEDIKELYSLITEEEPYIDLCEDELYLSAKTISLNLDQPSNEELSIYDKFFTRSITCNYIDNFASDDPIKYDVVYIEWLNPMECYGFLNFEFCSNSDYDELFNNELFKNSSVSDAKEVLTEKFVNNEEFDLVKYQNYYKELFTFINNIKK